MSIAIVEASPTGEAFWDTVEPDVYDLCFLDIFMDEMNGVEGPSPSDVRKSIYFSGAYHSIVKRLSLSSYRERIGC